MFPTGHLPDSGPVVATRIGLKYHPRLADFTARSSTLPVSTSNRAKLVAAGGILNQVFLSGCEGFAHALGASLLLAVAGTVISLPSPVALYIGALLCGRIQNPSGVLTGLYDGGTVPSAIQAAWKTFGALPAANDDQYPVNAQKIYINPNAAVGDADHLQILPPKLSRLYNDSPYRYQGAYFLSRASGSAARLQQILQVLASGIPITHSIAASGDVFQGYRGGTLGALSGDIDHCVLLVDYAWNGTSADWATMLTALAQGSDTQAASLATNLVFYCVNSWGILWGQGDSVANVPGGTFQTNIQYINQAEDLCALALSAA